MINKLIIVSLSCIIAGSSIAQEPNKYRKDPKILQNTKELIYDDNGAKLLNRNENPQTNQLNQPIQTNKSTPED